MLKWLKLVLPNYYILANDVFYLCLHKIKLNFCKLRMVIASLILKCRVKDGRSCADKS